MRDKNNINVSFVGPISPPISGPGITNKHIVNILDKEGYCIHLINTLKARKEGVLSNIVNIYTLFVADRVILSVSQKGRYILLPLLMLMKFITVKEYVVRVPGGNLDNEVESLVYPLRKIINQALVESEAVLTETKLLKESLRNNGICNASWLGNVRADRGFRWSYDGGTCKLLFLSQVRPEKGVKRIIFILDDITKMFETDIELDIYGPVDNSFENQFNSLVDARKYISYKGVVPFSKSQEVMSEYDVFVFPSVYEGEGYPGAIMEASIVGIPIVSSNIAEVREMIGGERLVCGDEKSSTDLRNRIIEVCGDETKAKNISHKLLSQSVNYKIPSFKDRLILKMNEIGWQAG